MNSRMIIGFIFVLMVSMTSNVVHDLTLHDTSVCDVCLHSQSNDDADLLGDEFSAVFSFESKSDQIIWHNNIHQKRIVDGASIRGPPFFC